MRKFGFFILVVVLYLFGCKEKTEPKKPLDSTRNVVSEELLYRPNFHFTPKKNWMNDPNGMFFLNGNYHLYFQYYPEGNTWGPMHWGHAISKDLMTWEERPIALYPDSLGYIFSGSAVVDVNNTSGFAQDVDIPVVAIYTLHNNKEEKEGRIDFQSQAIAYSLDEGQTFRKFKGNPVIQNPQIKDFRDPKVIWDVEHKKWVMVLAAGNKLMFYSSQDLKTWTFESEFGEHIGIQDGVWECPDFFPLKIEGTNEIKWVLLQSINPGHINGGSGTEYYIGDFDGNTFVLDEIFTKQLSNKKAIWLDYGRDNYAGVTWSNIPDADGRRLFIGWMSNWDYAQVVPTTTWRSAMTIPRELKLNKLDGEYILCSEPVKELSAFKKLKLNRKGITFKEEIPIIENNNIDVNKSAINIKLSNLNNDTYTFSLRNSYGDQLEFGINNFDHYYFIDRTKSGKVDFSNKFANTISRAEFENHLDKVSIQIIIDKTSIEIFYNRGEIVMTEIFFPNQPMENLKLFTLNKSETVIDELIVNQIELKD